MGKRVDDCKGVYLANGNNLNLYTGTQTGWKRAATSRRPADLSNIRSFHTRRTTLHRASDTTDRLPRDQRERRERRDAHAREFSLFGENARDVGNGGLVGRCGVWRSPVSGRSASFMVGGTVGDLLNGTPMSQR